MFGLDVKTAYLYSKLDEEIYMEMPKGFYLAGAPPGSVLRLNRALYGLKQSGCQWWIELSTSMKELGFTHAMSDAGIYYHQDKKSRELIIAAIYVDDGVFIGPKGSMLLKQKHQAFMKKWECRDLGPCKEFLGMNITCNRCHRTLTIDQSKYLKKVLEHFEVSGIEETPLPKGFVFKNNCKQASPRFINALPL
jgi:hypothetical protein